MSWRFLISCLTPLMIIGITFAQPCCAPWFWGGCGWANPCGWYPAGCHSTCTHMQGHKRATHVQLKV